MKLELTEICDYLLSKGAIAFEVTVGEVTIKANLAEPFAVKPTVFDQDGSIVEPIPKAAQDRMDAELMASYYRKEA